MDRAAFVNSAVAFASAELITAALHEVGHGLAAQALGFSPHVDAFYENNPSGDARQTLTILAAGPLTSLLLGAFFWSWYRRSTPRYSYGRLILLWLVVAARYADGVPSDEDERGTDAPVRIETAGIALFAALVVVYASALSRGVPI